MVDIVDKALRMGEGRQIDAEYVMSNNFAFVSTR